MVTAIDDYRSVEGRQKAAIFRLAIGHEHSTQMFEKMDDEEIQALAEAMSTLGTINAAMIARGVHMLSFDEKGKKLDPSAGVSELKKVGTQMKEGEPLMMIHYNHEDRLESALEYLNTAYRLAPKRPNPAPLVVERVA